MRLGIEDWYDDFWRLSKDRQVGMALGQIPYSTILSHTQGWPHEDADMFYECIDAMDRAYMGYDPKKVVSDEDPRAAFERMFGGS